MRLDEFVEPVDILSVKGRPLLIKDAFSSLAYHMKKASAEGTQWKVTDMYRAVTADILTFAGVVLSDLQPAELKLRTENIIKYISFLLIVF